MIPSKWSDKEADEFLQRYGKQHGEDLALRIYSARLLGREPTLVLHGGGNTSVKSTYVNVLGQTVPAIYVKGSGWDLAQIEPEGHPGLDLDYLRRLRCMPRMSDEVMVNELRTHLFLAHAPTPSVETLLHAFLPGKFIDHSHANQILALSNTTDGNKLLQDCFGEEVGYVSYVMPGFDLAKRAADVFDLNPKVSGLVLLTHGLFTFGATARESYERHIELVNIAEAFWRSRSKSKVTVAIESKKTDAKKYLPTLRGRLSAFDLEHRRNKRFVFDLRASKEILSILESSDLALLCKSAPLTPDHVIRTKACPMLLPYPGDMAAAEFTQVVDKGLAEFKEQYEKYFARCSITNSTKVKRLDACPRVILIPGVGLLGVGEDKKSARIAADIYEHTLLVKSSIQTFASYQALSDKDLFDVEYWPLEQAKLALNKPRPLQGKVALITGACGAIGVGAAKALQQAGAEVVISDVARVDDVSAELGVFGLEMDVTSEESIRSAMAEVILEFGGLDILILNAGIAVSAPIEHISAETAHKVMEVNFHGYLNVLRVASELFKLQGCGGNVVLVSSKNVLAPGKEFSIYSASKAAAHQLGKVAALELAEYGIRVNMIAPDAVFGSDKHPSGLWQSVGPARAKARGLEPGNLEDFYRNRNLLKTKILAEDVGQAVLFFVSELTPTTGATLSVDGGIAEAFVR